LTELAIGGETPINNSVLLYDSLKKSHPQFIKDLEDKVNCDSVIYIYRQLLIVL
jgi:hypothetical protein